MKIARNSLDSPTNSSDLLLDAVAFAARAHRHQLRKDGQTPYVAHPVRVCLILSHIFGITDSRVLAAALLHDTIEDTTTDFDDLADRFDSEVARWVAALTKDMRLPEDAREEAYQRALASADWPVIVCKLADIYDNLTDSRTLPASGVKKVLRRSAEYLETLRTGVPPEAISAFEIVEQRLASLRAGFSE